MPSTFISEKIAGLSDEELTNERQEWKDRKLGDACREGDLSAVKRLVAANADVNYDDYSVQNPDLYCVYCKETIARGKLKRHMKS